MDLSRITSDAIAYREGRRPEGVVEVWGAAGLVEGGGFAASLAAARRRNLSLPPEALEEEAVDNWAHLVGKAVRKARWRRARGNWRRILIHIFDREEERRWEFKEECRELAWARTWWPATRGGLWLEDA